MNKLPATLRPLLALLALSASSGCLDLDGFVHNPVHCTTVGAETCEEKADTPFDQICVPCAEDYDWTRDYPWLEGTLDEVVVAVRPVSTTVESGRLSSDDGEAQLDYYFVPSHGEDSALAQTTVIYNHGNYAGIEHYQPRVRFLHEAGYNVLVWDYRGYGKSQPETAPSPEQFLSDARQMRGHANTLVPDSGKIIVYANSLGGVPAVEMALSESPCALMLEAPFTSMSRVSGSNSATSFPESFFSQNHFDNVSKLEGYAGATLIMMGELDNKFPISDMEAIYDAVTGEKQLWIVPDARHGISNVGVPEAGLGPYFETMQSFLVDKAPACLTP
ncbi:MAG: hypothetical protein CMP23_02390 [Rickettsiales bacterium]|nr:hypothetical protein [Rickettsiales bacterium]